MKWEEFALAAWSAKSKATQRARFLAEMDAVIPWTKLLTLIAPRYSTAGSSPPIPIERMLRVYFLQQWFDLSDAQTEDALYDIEPMRRFAGIEPSLDIVPDEEMILRFRRLLKRHRLTEAIAAEIGTLLEERGLSLKSGTLVGATIVKAGNPTKEDVLELCDQVSTANRSKLTNRQAEILHLILEGNANSEIAQSLGIAEGTVKQHVHAIFGVLGVSSRTQAVIASMQYDFFVKARNGIRQGAIRNLP